jgi:hypothetical protein
VSEVQSESKVHTGEMMLTLTFIAVFIAGLAMGFMLATMIANM